MNERTLRQEMLLGAEAMEKLAGSHVAVFGLGGVGSWCCEALARSGIGELTLVDRDSYGESNINRQLYARTGTLNRPKAEVAAEAVRLINPDVRLHVITGHYEADRRAEFLADYDFVADAIDLVSCKLDLILTCRERGIPIISALGTGNKRDAALLRIDDISKTSGDALARVMRRELRDRGVNHHPVVFSPEEPMEPRQFEAPPPGRRSVPGSLVWVPAAAGLLMCQYIVNTLVEPFMGERRTPDET